MRHESQHNKTDTWLTPVINSLVGLIEELLLAAPFDRASIRTLVSALLEPVRGATHEPPWFGAARKVTPLFPIKSEPGSSSYEWEMLIARLRGKREDWDTKDILRNVDRIMQAFCAEAERAFEKRLEEAKRQWEFEHFAS